MRTLAAIWMDKPHDKPNMEGTYAYQMGETLKASRAIRVYEGDRRVHSGIIIHFADKSAIQIVEGVKPTHLEEDEIDGDR